jgi:uncharacterized phage protein (TIGR01671 family)
MKLENIEEGWMRAIKFRGKRVDDDEWVYGSLMQHLEDDVAYIQWQGIGLGKNMGVIPDVDHSYEVFPETVGQLFDLPDRNGQELYEGDLIKCPIDINNEYHGDWCINEIMVIKGQWIASYISSEKGKLPRGYTRSFLLDAYFEYDVKLFCWGKDYTPNTDIEKIGNIYDDSELLEKIR